MNIKIDSSFSYYNEAINKKKSLTELSGRYPEDSGSEKYIFEDICQKLVFKKKFINLLDIGCGCGKLSYIIINFLIKKKIKLYLCDFRKIIFELKKKLRYKKINFISSDFLNYNFKNLKFDRILIYSVIQHSKNPKFFLNKAFSLLNKNGILLIGDIPNIDKKYRFLKSKIGQNIEKKRKIKTFDYKKLTVNYKSFLKNTNQNLLINDKLVKWVKKYFTKKGAKVLIYKQPSKLPFSYTRLDILIKKNA